MTVHAATPRLAAAGLAAFLAGPALAAPAVVADIAPVHSIVARVMAGVGEPTLLLLPGASPHGYALRPSEAARLESADLVFWVGPELTPWLEGPLGSLTAEAEVAALAAAPGVARLPVRAGGPFEAHTHDDDHAHDDHAHDEHDHDDHDHDEHDHAGHADEGAVDGHVWLDPLNGAAMARAVAERLAAADPANAEAYRANAAAFAGEMEALAAEIGARLAAVADRGFIVFHDAYQYFEARFDIAARGAIALHDADQPSPARMAAIRDRVREAGVVCVFAEPQFDPRLIATATEGTDTRRATLDPLGADQAPGPGLYPALLRSLADEIATCLED